MPIGSAGKVQYKGAQTYGGIRYQAYPPVCNICGQQITRENFGCAYIEVEGPKKFQEPEQFERIECTACTLIRESGESLRAFLTRHHL
jgi:hypothetical protein